MKTDKIRILRVMTRLNIGGPTRQALFLTQGLNNSRYESFLVYGKVSAGEGEMRHLIKNCDEKTRYLPQLSRQINIVNDVRAFVKLTQLIRQIKPHILHTHMAKAGALARAAAIMAPRPIALIHTYHGHIFKGYFSAWKSLAFRFIERTLGSFTDAIIAVSPLIKKELVEKYRIADAKKIHVVPLGFDLSALFESPSHRNKLRREVGISEGTILVGTVGRLAPIKNHYMFLSAAKELKARNVSRDTKFIIVGDGELKEDLVVFAKRLRIMDEVIFLGWRHDLEVVYADIDIVCLTSLNEGTPVSLIEAQAAAKPVIGTDVGGVRDLVKDGLTGRIVRSGDVKGFVDALVELIEDPLKREKWGQAGRRFCEANFSSRRLLGEIEMLYGKILREKRGLKYEGIVCH